MSYINGYSAEETARLDHQHGAYKAMLHGKLFSSRVRDAAARGEVKRVLDVGTGTGIWCYDALAELHALSGSQGQVIVGTDVVENEQWKAHSGPGRVFVQADLNDEAGMLKIAEEHGPFDVVSARLLSVAIKEGKWETFMQTLAKLLRPGGFVQLLEIDAINSHSCPTHAGQTYREGAEALIVPHALYRVSGCDPHCSPRLAERLRRSGFVGVTNELIYGDSYDVNADGSRTLNKAVDEWMQRTNEHLKPIFLKVRQLPHYKALLDRLPPWILELTDGRPEALLKDEAEYDDFARRHEKRWREDPAWHCAINVAVGQKAVI